MTSNPKPHYRDYRTADGLHAAMRSWAAKQCRFDVELTAKFSDSEDLYVDTFARATKEVFYKTADGEIYGVNVETSKFVCWLSDDPVTYGQLKKLVEPWLAQDLEPGVTLVSTKWKRVKL